MCQDMFLNPSSVRGRRNYFRESNRLKKGYWHKMSKLRSNGIQRILTCTIFIFAPRMKSVRIHWGCFLLKAKISGWKNVLTTRPHNGRRMRENDLLVSSPLSEEIEEQCQTVSFLSRLISAWTCQACMLSPSFSLRHSVGIKASSAAFRQGNLDW